VACGKFSKLSARSGPCTGSMHLTPSQSDVLNILHWGTQSTTVPFHSIWQSCITGPSKMLKCHGCHSDFHGVPNSFGKHVTNIEIFLSPAALNCRKFTKNLGMSQQLWEVAETKISVGPSRVMGPAKLNEMVQYLAHTKLRFV